jgi:serine/threonine protein kinase
MALTIGSQLGSHEIAALLGKGGMDEVYRARDLRLTREVAIKILPEEFSRVVQYCSPNHLVHYIYSTGYRNGTKTPKCAAYSE